jgi:S-DNA-T family DNA segregation ATPase FtsK/SpoIIIE
VPPAKKPTKKQPPARARRRPAARRTPVIEQRHLDLVGLALVAFAVFLGFVLYRDRDGGAFGERVVDGLTRLLGDIAYAVPVALAAAGALLVLRPVLPAVRPFRSGALCLLAGALLLLPDSGWVGDEVRGAVATVVGGLGADVLGFFLFAAALLLLTGATIAGVVAATRDGVADTTRVIRTAAPALPRRMPRIAPPEVEPSVSARARRRRAADPEAEVESEREREPEAGRAPDPVPVPVPVSDPPSGAFVMPDDLELDPPTAPFAPAAADEPEPEPEPDEPALAEAPLAEAADDEEDDEEPAPEDAAVRAATRAVTPEDLTPQGRYRPHVTDDPEFPWQLPAATLLDRSTADQLRPDTHGQAETARNLIEALQHFGIQAQVTGTVAGPHITRYELRLAPGVKMSKVANLKDDLAYALAATDIRILAPIPGKTAVGVEVPNARRRLVQLGDVFGRAPDDWSPLTVWLGKDVAGKAIGADLAKMPHLLVAGTTGAGKSACVNAMLSSILLNATPHEVKLVLVDPKQVELNLYEGIPHLLTPVITNPKKAANALANLVKEMEDRYATMSFARTRNLPELNRVREAKGEVALPYILCVIDELADLMMVAPADVEDSIIRLAQKARAVGIHLVLATQSPRVDVITGMIKANVPSRIAFAVSSQTDSRVILDQNGAESLLGKGDMLFSPVGSAKLQRIQGAFLDEPQVEAITEAWRRQGAPELREDLLEDVEPEEPLDVGGGEDDGFDPDEDPLLEEATRLVVDMGTASTSMLQRRLRLGYTRAGRLMDMLERRGVISGYEGSKPRQVLVAPGDVDRFLATLRVPAGPDPAPE